MTGEGLIYGALTDVGRQRELNEDNYLVDRKLGLFVVCDGMGGHSAGEIASAIAVRTLHEEVKKEFDLVQDYVRNSAGGARVSRRDVTHLLEFAANRASSRVYGEAERDPSRRGMGTTLAALLVAGRTAFVTWVGDSRVYLLRGDQLEQLTVDHSARNELLRRRKLTVEQVEALAPRSALARAVGIYPHVEPESVVIDLVGGDRLLVCSDGLSSYFDTSTDLLRLAQLLDAPPEEAATALVGSANERGGADNITAVVVAVPGDETTDADRAGRLRLQRQVLARMRLFRPLNDQEILRILEVTTVEDHADGHRIICQGDEAAELFIVLSGKVTVLSGDTPIRTLEPGEHFGEMALIRSQPRSASVVSQGPSALMRLSRHDFLEILRKEQALAVKLLWQLTGSLADRLVETTRELGRVRAERAEEVTAELEVFGGDEEDEADRITLEIPPRPRAAAAAARPASEPSTPELPA